jgi:hypothetical protein
LLAQLRQITEDELGMDALVEVHTKEEMRRALAIGARLIGVNNRNLKTFAVSLETSVELARESIGGALLISESGLEKPDDLNRLQQLGYRGFLIGESLMRAEAPDIALRALLDNIERYDVRPVLKILRDSDGRRRVDIFRRPNGTFGFEELRWFAEEQAWVPVGRYSESFNPSLDQAESEARHRVQWLSAGDPADN